MRVGKSVSVFVTFFFFLQLEKQEKKPLTRGYCQYVMKHPCGGILWNHRRDT